MAIERRQDRGGGSFLPIWRGHDFALARYNSDGSLDTSFDGDGKVTTDFGDGGRSGPETSPSTLRGDRRGGRGGAESPYVNDFALARYNSDGSLDNTFGGWRQGDQPTSAPRMTMPGAWPSTPPARSWWQDTRNRAVPPGSDFALARYNSDGSLDATFGTAGLVTTDFASSSEYAYGVAVDGNGQIVVAGHSYQDGTGWDFALARYDANFGVGEITTPTNPVEVHTEITAGAVFADQDLTHTHSALWDWGDGTTSAGTVTEPISDAVGTVSGSHPYANAGVYTITLTVAVDETGDTDQSIFQYVVVFDPNAGFVTGGGWIDSPQGAIVSSPWATDKANLGFVAKYVSGADQTHRSDSVPRGRH